MRDRTHDHFLRQRDRNTWPFCTTIYNGGLPATGHFAGQAALLRAFRSNSVTAPRLHGRDLARRSHQRRGRSARRARRCRCWGPGELVALPASLSLMHIGSVLLDPFIMWLLLVPYGNSATRRWVGSNKEKQGSSVAMHSSGLPCTSTISRRPPILSLPQAVAHTHADLGHNS